MQTLNPKSLQDVQVLDLTTGRQFSKQRTVELWFVTHLNRFYVMAEYGHETGWVKNLRKHSEASITCVGNQMLVRAWILDQGRDRGEWRIVVELFREKYGWGDGLPVALEPSENQSEVI